MSDDLWQLREDLSNDLDRIASRFKNPKLTLIIRNPDVPGDSSVVLSSDTDYDAVRWEYERFVEREQESR